MTSPDRQVKIVVAADVAAAIRGLTEVSNAAGNVGGASQDAEKKSSSWLDALKTGLGVVGVQTGLDGVVSGFKAVVQMGMTYEDSLNTLRAVTGANDQQMQQMGDTAKALGNDVLIPGASASEAASAMLELAKGGLTAQQAMDASRGTMILAAAAQIDGAEAAEIQANALNTFGLKADQAGRVANVLANVANKSSGEITDFAQGLSQAGTVASSFGWSIEETTTMLGLMANAGIKGSDAGTSLKTTMTAMLKPTEAQAAALEQLGIKTTDSAGKMIGARDLTEQLAAAKGRMTDAEFNAAAATAFGTDAVRTALVAAQQAAGGYDQMNEALNNSTGAADVAAANTAGLSGSLDKFMNSVQAVGLSLYETLAPALQSIVEFGAGAFDWLGDVVGWFTDLDGPVRNAALALGAVVLLRGPLAAIGPAISRWIGTAVLNFNALAVAARAGSFSMATFGAAAKGAMAMLGGPIGLAIIGVTTALSFMGSETDDVAASTADFSAAIDDNTGKLVDNADAVIAKAAADSGSFDAIEAIGGSVEDYTLALMGNEDAQERIHTLLLDQAEAALKGSDAWGRMVAKGNAVPEKAREIASGLLESGDAGAYASGEFDAVLLASQRYAADSDNMTTAERQKQQALEAAGTAAGTAAGSVEELAGQSRQAAAAATPFTDALKDMRGAASEADAAAQFLNLTLIEMAGGQVTAEQATRANEAAFREIGSAARDYAGAQQKVADKEAELTELSKHLGAEYEGQVVTQADLDRVSRELAEAKTSVADADDKQFDSATKAAESAISMTAAAYNNKAAQGDMRGAIDDATRVMQEQRQKFIDAQVQINGGNIPAAEAYADKLGLIPGNVRTTFEQQGVDAAIQRAAELNAQLRKIDGQVVKYTVVGSTVYQGLASSVGPTALQALHQADGGFISGPGSGTSDDIPAMLSNGEFVINAKSTEKWRPLLEKINAGRFARGGLVRFAAGGPVGAADAKGDAETTTVSASLTAPDPELFEKSWEEITAATQRAWDAGISPVLDELSATNTKTGEEVKALDEGVVQPAWQNISTNIQSSWDRTILPTYTQLNKGTETGGIWQNWLRDLTAQAWQQNQASVSNATNWLLGVTFPSLNSGAQGVGAEQRNLAATTDAAWTQIGGKIQGTYDGQIVPAWDGVKGFANATGAFFQGIQAGVTGASGTVLSEIGKIRGAISSFMQLVGGSVPAAATGGSVAALLDAKADGGPITQGTGPRSDDVLIRVSKGEYVVNAEATARNRGVLDAMNFGGHTPAFADGGAVGEKIRGPVENTLVNASHKAIEDAIDKLVTSVGGFFSNGQWGPPNSGGLAANTQAARDFIVKNWGITNIGGWRSSGSVAGSDHPSGKALDVMIANYLSQAGIAQGDSVASWFINNPNAFGTKYVIWRDRINQGGSWGPYSHPGGNNDTLAHRDHVHLSFLTGSGAFSGTPVGDTPAGGGSWLDRMLGKIGGGVPGGAAAAYNPSGGVEQWRGLGMSVLQRVGQYVGQNLMPYINNMMLQIRTESGGSPNAINNWDINAQRGDPSIGILQVIGSTFRNALSGTPFAGLIARGQRDPEASMTASTLYSLRRYGSLDRAWRGVAYDTGGVWPDGTAGWNTSGGPEMVLKPWQWAAAQSAIQQVTNQANRTYQGGQHGGVQIGTIVNNTGSDLKRELQYAAVCARG